jgi:hypothetical protein
MMIGAQTNLCGDTLIQKAGLCIPFLNVYAFGGILIIFIKQFFSPFYAVIISGIVLTLFECMSGCFSKIVENGQHLWDYNIGQHFGVFCDGYTSLDLWIFWTFVALIINLVVT